MGSQWYSKGKKEKSPKIQLFYWKTVEDAREPTQWME